jgi:hypothetical protein
VVCKSMVFCVAHRQPDILEEHIFHLQCQRAKTSTAAYYLLLLVSCLAYPLTMEMEVIHSSEMSGFLQTRQCYNREYCTL